MKGKQYQHKKEGTCLCDRRLRIAMERIAMMSEIDLWGKPTPLEQAKFLARNVLLLNEKLHRSKKSKGVAI
jgi:hypothetical protein